MKLKHILKTVATLTVLAGPSVLTTQSAYAQSLDEIKLEQSSTQDNLSNLQTQVTSSMEAIDGLNGELSQLDTEINDIESAITQSEEDIKKQEEVVQERFEQAKARLQSIQLTNVNQSLFLSLLESDSLQDLLNRVNAVVHLSQASNEQIESARHEQEVLENMTDELEAKRDELTSTKDAVKDKKESVDQELDALETLISENKQALKELKQKEGIEVARLEEAEKLAAEHRQKQAEQKAVAEAEVKSAQATQQEASQSTAQAAPAQPQQSAQPAVQEQPSVAQSTAQYTINDLEFQGVIHALGNKWTFYSERVLPGHGLNIPGRHTSGGFVRDGSGYIVLAANSGIAHGTVVNTPFGSPGKVYDTCASCHAGWLDVYTR